MKIGFTWSPTRSALASAEAAYRLAKEVARLRAELLSANAEQERLENQLDQVRSELVATYAKIEEWEDVIEDARSNLSAHLPFPIPAKYDRIPTRDTTERS